MKRLLPLLFGLSLVVSVILVTWSSNAFADEVEANVEANAEVMTEAVQQSTILLRLEQKLASTKYRLYLLQNNVVRATEGLEEIQAVIKHLEATVANLDLQIKDTDKKVLSVKSQMEVKKREKKKLEEEALILEMQLEDQKAIVGELMTLLYVKRGIYYEDGEINAVKVFASKNSVSKTLQSITYLDIIEKANQAQIVKMAALSDSLAEKWQDIHQKQRDLDTLDSQLAADLLQLGQERDAQAALLDETTVEASIFVAMLASSDESEANLLREIEIYEKNVELMKANLSSTQILLSEEQQDLISKIELDMAEQFSSIEASDFLDIDWPVSPERGLTAFFNDESYKGAFGVDHYALDIRAKHGDLIYAPADGVVSNIVFDPDSTRYAYIEFQLRKGASVVVGHVSDVAVEVGDFVQRGMVIGATGATPGSIGAGVRTTGPHLHFEVRQYGLRVDPLLYLPLDELPEGELPEEYIEVLQGQLEDDLRDIQELLLE